MTNYEHLFELETRPFVRAIFKIVSNRCICCPKERERRCNEDCAGGIVEWLYAEYIPDSIIWKRTRRKSKK